MSHPLPAHGRINCTLCHNESAVDFDQTQTEEEGWRITANPLAWGSARPSVVVLGFSKGPTQAGALAGTSHDEIAFKGGRVAVGKIFAHVGLIPSGENNELRNSVDRLIADPGGPFHFGSLVRCTVERFDDKSRQWKGSGGGMLDKFATSALGQKVASQCTRRFLTDLPDSVRLIVMFGLGAKGNYVREARKLIEAARPGYWRTINDVAYADKQISVVHVEHFASQGALIPNWLGVNNHPRSKMGEMARSAVWDCLGLNREQSVYFYPAP